MANNEILPMVETDTGTNLLTQSEWNSDTQRPIGNQPGIARSKLINKALRQVTKVSSAIAKYIADRQQTDITDSLTTTNFALYLHRALNRSNVAAVTGTSDAIVLGFTPAATELLPGLVQWKAGATNTTTTPTVQRDALAVKSLVKGANVPIEIGDIVTGGIYVSYYDSVLDKEVLINPGRAAIAPASYKDLKIIGASVAANALTITGGPFVLDFRSTTLGSGATSTVSGTPANLVVPTGATLGGTSAIQQSLVVIAMNNAGTIELAVGNLIGGVDISETGLISTTAISSGASSAGVFYSTTARTNLAYRVVGLIESTQATAGQWITAPSKIQGAGGNALDAMQSIGFGQSWQSPARSLGTTYYNTTGKPIYIAVMSANGSTGNRNITATINGVGVTFGGGYVPGADSIGGTILIPAGASYSVTVTNGSLQSWSELR